jgi:hypothetical protein
MGISNRLSNLPFFGRRERGTNAKREVLVSDSLKQTESPVREMTGPLLVPQASEPCALCGDLNQTTLENKRDNRFKVDSMKENAEANGCLGCRMLWWITSEFIERRKGPGWVFKEPTIRPATDSRPFQLLINAEDNNNRRVDPRLAHDHKDRIVLEIFTTQGMSGLPGK